MRYNCVKFDVILCAQINEIIQTLTCTHTTKSVFSMDDIFIVLLTIIAKM